MRGDLMNGIAPFVYIARDRIVPDQRLAIRIAVMTKLSVNVNKVATLRNTRTIGIPSVTRAARICLEAGANGITLHPRPDARHIRREDVFEIAALMESFPEAEFNIEGNPFHAYMEYARELRPTQCTLVPDEPDVFTSNQGWDLRKDGERLRPVIETLRSYGCRVSIFMDADPEMIALVPATGADRIELYTEPYAAGFASGRGEEAVRPFVEAAACASSLGIGVNAGHDLNRDNLPLFINSVPDLLEVSIGHALIADALELGLAETVRQYLEVIRSTSSER
jgi:pyridoxine 5-phosphate synthase